VGKKIGGATGTGEVKDSDESLKKPAYQ